MDILLITSPVIWNGVKRPIFPLGLSYVGTYLEQHGHHVALLDLNLYDGHLEKLKDTLTKHNFKFIGVSVRNVAFYSEVQTGALKNIVSCIKSFSPASKIFCGGSGFSLIPEVIMKTVREIDTGVIGRGEQAFMELMEKQPGEVKGTIYREAGQLRFAPSRQEMDLDELPVPKRDWPGLDLSKYDMLNLQTRRGCPFKCKFCLYKRLEGTEVKCRNINSVSKELDYLESLGAKKIFFSDNVFNYPLDYSLRLLDVLKKRDIEWGAYFRIDLLNKDYVDKLMESKCSLVIFSAESGSQAIHERFETGLSVSTVLKSVNTASLLAKKKKTVIFSFIIGFPEERLRDIFLTLGIVAGVFLKRCKSQISFYFMPDTADSLEKNRLSPDGSLGHELIFSLISVYQIACDWIQRRFQEKQRS